MKTFIRLTPFFFLAYYLAGYFFNLHYQNSSISIFFILVIGFQLYDYFGLKKRLENEPTLTLPIDNSHKTGFSYLIILAVIIMPLLFFVPQITESSGSINKRYFWILLTAYSLLQLYLSGQYTGKYFLTTEGIVLGMNPREFLRWEEILSCEILADQGMININKKDSKAFVLQLSKDWLESNGESVQAWLKQYGTFSEN